MYSHISQARHTFKRLGAKLHVVAVVFNPLRFQTRRNLFREFQEHALRHGAELWVVELAQGDRPFEVTDASNPQHIQFRTRDELWHKERMINVAVSRLPADWEYMAWVDADVTFANPDWVHETMQQLQHYEIAQMFSHAIDLGPNMEPINTFNSFTHSHMRGIPQYKKMDGYYGNGKYWHPGFAWAYRRHAWNTLGGLLDINIVGGGDYQMAYALIGRVKETIPPGTGDHYRHIVENWANNAAELKQNIGVVPGTLLHHFHGKKVNRGYYSRWRILVDNHFDPLTDVKNDWQGLLALTGNKPKLRDDLRAYFRARNEDSI